MMGVGEAEGKTCNRCQKKGLGWDKEFHKKTGKWKLENHKLSNGTWCNKPREELMMRKKHEVELCKLCNESKFGLCTDNMNEHLALYHKNGNIMTDLDYKIANGMSISYLKHWKSDKHYGNYAYLVK